MANPTVYTLKESGGDYDSLTNVFTQLSTLIGNGLADDYVIEVEGGKTFGSLPTDTYTTSAAGNRFFNGHYIKFITAPDDLATPATLRGNYEFNGQTVDEGTIRFENLILEVQDKELINLGQGTAGGISRIGEIVNCRVFQHLDGGGYLFNAESGRVPSAASHLTNSSWFTTSSTINITELSVVSQIASDIPSCVRNSIIATYSTQAINLVMHVSPSFDSVLYNYGAGTLAFSGVGGATESNVADNTDPQLAVNVVQGFDELAATMSARDDQAASSSSYIVGTANATYAPAIDILNIERPQGTGDDIGPYELVSSAPAPAPVITTGNQAKHAAKIGTRARDVDPPGRLGNDARSSEVSNKGRRKIGE